MIDIIVARVEKHVINKQNKNWKLIDELCFKSKNLYNYGNYIVRQKFINSTKETGKGHWIKYHQLYEICKDSEPYKEMGSNVGQQTLMMLNEAWRSFFLEIKDWKKNPFKYLGRPKLPKYKDKNGRYSLGIDNIKFRVENGFIYFSWKPLKVLNNIYKTKIPIGSKIVQCRFTQKGNNYVMEIIYDIEVPETNDETNKICSIDIGLENFVTIVNNIDKQPIIIKGGILKSINQFYNKELAKIKSELKIKNNKNWSNKLDRLTFKRDCKIDNFMHLCSKRIVDYCIENNIDTIVIGQNKEWKQDINIGKRNNQTFVQIPVFKFIKQLLYKSENVGIKVILQEESYTSKASFLDLDEIPIYEKNKHYEFSGKRIKRGLYKSANGIIINADVNGAYNIMKKAVSNAFADGIEGVDLHPIKFKLN